MVSAHQCVTVGCPRPRDCQCSRWADLSQLHCNNIRGPNEFVHMNRIALVIIAVRNHLTLFTTLKGCALQARLRNSGDRTIWNWPQ